ncbi:MAG TPA: phosphohistidine phosphatase SixA [Gemmataceae bacterium]|nr:phosphohistidine phosphatase SixA [Gemmataceae bacterium]
MDVYLIRHAEAVERNPESGMTDEDRPLTEAGRAQAQHIARSLPGRGATIERLFVSPTVRTRQTAEPLVAAWGLTGAAVVDCPELAPDRKIRKLVKQLTKEPAGSIGLVGHRPDLNEFAAWLIGSKKVRIAMDKGGIALIRVDDEEMTKGSGELVWLMPDGWI